MLQRAEFGIGQNTERMQVSKASPPAAEGRVGVSQTQRRMQASKEYPLAEEGRDRDWSEYGKKARRQGAFTN